MDWTVKGSRFRLETTVLDVERKGIFELAEVDIGYEFIQRLVALRMSEDGHRPHDKADRQKRFKRDKDAIARQMGYDTYMSLPKGAKAFESRCSAIKKKQHSLDYLRIAQMEKTVNEHKVRELRESIRLVFENHVKKWIESEGRRNLVLRMCRYNRI
jgi:hypothetical protein